VIYAVHRTLGHMIWFLIFIIVVAVVAYRFRLPILAKLLGQSQDRVQRALERRKK
jgi:Sec-independent protein translocase protein TatA